MLLLKKKLEITLVIIQQPCSKPLRRLRVRFPSPLTTWVVALFTVVEKLNLKQYFFMVYILFEKSNIFTQKKTKNRSK